MENVTAKCSIESSVFDAAVSEPLPNSKTATFIPLFLSSCVLGGVQEPQEGSCAVQGILIGATEAGHPHAGAPEAELLIQPNRREMARRFLKASQFNVNDTMMEVCPELQGGTVLSIFSSR